MGSKLFGLESRISKAILCRSLLLIVCSFRTVYLQGWTQKAVVVNNHCLLTELISKEYIASFTS